MSKHTGVYITLGVAALAITMASIVLFQVNHHPRTDDASVHANYIQFAPEVSGRVAKLAVKDNQYVQKGTLLSALTRGPTNTRCSSLLLISNFLRSRSGMPSGVLPPSPAPWKPRMQA